MADSSTVPAITITITDQVKLQGIETAIGKCCEAKGVKFSDIAIVDGNHLTLKLNQGEGMELFKNDEILKKHLKSTPPFTEDEKTRFDQSLGIVRKLFDGTKPLTKTNLDEINKETGITVSREPSLLDEFRTQEKIAIENAKHIKISPPATSVEDTINANHVTVVGELHPEEAARLLIALKLPELHEKKGAVLIEGIPANRQKMLDDWLHDNGKKTPVPPLIRFSLEANTGKGTEDYYNAVKLLEDAKKAHVDVYAYDSDAAFVVNYGMMPKHKDPKDGKIKIDPDFTLPEEINPEHLKGMALLNYRLLLMNQAASDRIKEIEKDHPGKILVSAGGAHAASQPDLPGLGDWVGGGQLFITVPDSKYPDAIPPGAHAIIVDPQKLKKELRESSPDPQPGQQQQGEPDGVKKNSSPTSSKETPDAHSNTMDAKAVPAAEPLHPLLARCRELNDVLPPSDRSSAGHPSGVRATAKAATTGTHEV